MSYHIIILVSCYLTISLGAYPNMYKKVERLELPLDADVGEPLIITPYLESNNIAEARAASLVTIEEFAGIPSYTGFFTVDKLFDSNLFFWFIPSQGNVGTDPVLLWLQGGPGSSSLYALFGENGPYVVKNDDQFSLREYSWTRNHSVIYIDNPVGTGYSFTNGGYCRNETKVGEHLYEALIQFFTLFPELQKNPFFVSGESYAGKYLPAISYTIYKKNPTANLKINLQGILIGNGLSDPENMISEYGDYLYELGLIDENERSEVIEYQDRAIEYIKQEKFMDAFLQFDALLNGDFTRPTLFDNATGIANYFNYAATSDYEDLSYERFLQTAKVRKAIHVGNLPYGDLSQEVEENLREDILKSVAPWISELLSHYRILFFNGQLDIIVAYPLTRNFLKNLNFSSAEEYKTAPRHIWRVDDEVAGYVKQAGNLTEVLVRSAGHMVPLDQPRRAYDLVYRFIRSIPLE